MKMLSGCIGRCLEKDSGGLDHILKCLRNYRGYLAYMAPKLNQGNYAIVRTDVVIGVRIQKES